MGYFPRVEAAGAWSWLLAFIVCSVSFIVCVVLCAVFVWVWCVFCVLCLIVVHCHRIKTHLQFK
jgi:hypothetical protein